MKQIIVDLRENAVMYRPTAAPHGVGKLGLAERCAVIQFFKEPSSRLKKLMDLFHLVISVEIAEPVSLISDCVVIKEDFQSHALEVEDPAEKFEYPDHLPGQTQAPSDLPGKESGLHGLFLFGKIPGAPPEQGISPLMINMGIELGGVRIVDNEKIPVNLRQIV